MARKKPPELLPGTLDLMILKTLAVGPNHGYGIARRIKQTSDDVLHVEEGSLYPALHRLAKRGCLDSEWRSSESNRRAKYYRLTRKGRTKLKAQTRNWAQLTTAIDKVLSARTAGKAATKGWA
ncbi:MAG: PadR family transcriptional regulator [Planctomycetes bacterium]|nr:PadR family transcriptional regulator [Planctomycetota bacterium]